MSVLPKTFMDLKNLIDIDIDVDVDSDSDSDLCHGIKRF